MCKTRDGGAAACGREKVHPFFFANRKEMEKTNQERLEDKCCIKTQMGK